MHSRGRIADPPQGARPYRVVAYELVAGKREIIIDHACDAFYVAAIRMEGSRVISDHHPVGPGHLLERIGGFIADHLTRWPG